jgi:type I restriction enzyme M protein
MLTTKLQESLNQAWQNCWPVSDLRPIALLDLISYLFFIKKSDDLALIHQKVKAAGAGNFIFTKETENFSWSNLQNLHARDIHQLFTKEHGIIDLVNNYAGCDALFSDYLKAPLLIDPTPKLLSNAIDIINLIETSNNATREKIAEYLFMKSGMSSENRQLFLPQHILNLMTSIAEPVAADTVFDPAAGNGKLLISAFKFMHHNGNSLSPHGAKEIKISGLESDGVRLRIAAMNMILHGINDPDIHLTTGDKKSNEKPSLIISALSSQNEASTVAENTSIDFAEKEASLLNEIADNLSGSGRAVVLVSQDLLQTEDPAIIKTRKKLVDQFNLEGVITLVAKNSSAYSGTAILIFNRSAINSEDIWFYKWKSPRKKLRDISENDQSSDYEIEEAEKIADLWKTRKEVPAAANSFFIPVDFLRNNHYKLSFNDYKLAHQQQSLEPESVDAIDIAQQTPMAATKENLHEFFESSTPLPHKKRKRRVAPVLLVVLVLVCAVAFYWVYSKDNAGNFPWKISHSSPNALLIDHDSAGAEINNRALSSNDSGFVKDRSNRAITEPKGKPRKYMVLNKAWFHYEPDSARIKPVYLMPRDEVMLTPGDEQNGFIYVVYINSKGEATHGWLDKKDLQAID